MFFLWGSIPEEQRTVVMGYDGVEMFDPVDADYLVQIYNSNNEFLTKHMRTDNVSTQWVVDELSQ